MGMISTLAAWGRRGWTGLDRSAATPAGRVFTAQALARLRGRGTGGARLATLLAALPVPALAVGVILCSGALIYAPAQTEQMLQLLALLPEGLWWALASLAAAAFGLRLQAQEQAFARDMAQPPLAVGEADPGPDAALALGAEQADDNPALAAWRDAVEDVA